MLECAMGGFRHALVHDNGRSLVGHGGLFVAQELGREEWTVDRGGDSRAGRPGVDGGVGNAS